MSHCSDVEGTCASREVCSLPVASFSFTSGQGQQAGTGVETSPGKVGIVTSSPVQLRTGAALGSLGPTGAELSLSPLA